MKKLLMKKILSKKKRRINSKKGLTLLELIVAIIILLLVISATVSGLNLSYRSVLIGAEKDDAQSLAQRNCDIVMAIISKRAENGTLSSILDASGSSFEATFFENYVKEDMKLELHSTSLGVSTGYDPSQYEFSPGAPAIEQYSGGTLTADSNVKKQYIQLETEDRELLSADGTTTKIYKVYKITIYVYYGYEDNMYVTCEGEVNVEP